jgi:isopenicillin N synthase-like dioxygenase
MSFGTIMKLFQYNILSQSGIAVTPQQLGLKPEQVSAMAGLAGGNATTSSPFSQFLGTQNANLPTAPTAPEDPADTAAQAKFNQEMVAYNQQMQAYNQRMMQMLLQQFNLMQQKIQSINTQQSNNQNRDLAFDRSGVGGILGGASEL